MLNHGCFPWSLKTYLFVLECLEYAKAVYAEEVSPVLSAKTSSDKVSQCGILEIPLIIGGVKATPKEFPHMVRRLNKNVSNVSSFIKTEFLSKVIGIMTTSTPDNNCEFIML